MTRRAFQPYFCRQLVVFLAVCFSVFGCTTSQVLPPDVQLVDVQFGEVSLFQSTLLVTTQVRNEGEKSLQLSGSLHELSLNDIPVGKAVSQEKFTLLPLESKKVVAELELSHLLLITRLQELLQSSSLDYVLKSKFYRGTLGTPLLSTQSGTLIRGQINRVASPNRHYRRTRISDYREDDNTLG